MATPLADLWANRNEGYSTDVVKGYLQGIDPNQVLKYADHVHALSQQLGSAITSLNQQRAAVQQALPAGETGQAALRKLDVAVAALTTVKGHVDQFEQVVRGAAPKLKSAVDAYNGQAGVQPRIQQAATSRNGKQMARTMAAQSQGRAAQGAAQGQPNANPLADLLKGLGGGAGSGSSTPASTPAPAPTTPTTPTTPMPSGTYPYSNTAIDPTTGRPVHGIQISFHADGSFDVTSTPGVDPTTGQPTDQSADITVLTQDPSTHQTVSHQVHIGSDGTGTVLT